jgi:tyrosinase
MPFTRKDLWRLGNDWNDEMLWYARAVADLQSRPIGDATSWGYLAAMHGFDPQLWQAFGYLAPGTRPPSTAGRDWDQCQHQSWFFLPWHRGYLWSFESIVRASIIKQGGPADWALPYWNYNNPANANARTLPLSLTAATLPDGSQNPLAPDRRYGANGRGQINLNPAAIALDCLTEPDFVGVPSGGSPGFGGAPTAFHHGGEDNAPNGMLESMPHNNVHDEVGGHRRGTNPNDARNLGLMSMPETAALDPVFWLHHANVDRLWEVWRARDSAHFDPTDPTWLGGPTTRAFVVPDAQGNPLTFAPRDMLDVRAQNLDYVYEDTSDPLGGVSALAARHAILASARRAPPAPGRAPVRQPAELLGANDTRLQLGAEPVETRVRLDRPTTARVRQSLQSFAAAGTGHPDRVFLNLENIRSEGGGGSYRVYVAPPGVANAPDNLAGTMSLFGVRKASRGDGPRAGNGLNTVLDVTRIVDRLHVANSLDTDHLVVRFVPATETEVPHQVSVGRVSLYRQGR